MWPHYVDVKQFNVTVLDKEAEQLPIIFDESKYYNVKQEDPVNRKPSSERRVNEE